MDFFHVIPSMLSCIKHQTTRGNLKFIQHFIIYHIAINLHTDCTLQCFLVLGYRSIVALSNETTSLTLAAQWYDCPNACRVILKNMGKYITGTHIRNMCHNHNKSKNSKTGCIYNAIDVKQAKGDYNRFCLRIPHTFCPRNVPKCHLWSRRCLQTFIYAAEYE